jgi:hypothetical protein
VTGTRLWLALIACLLVPALAASGAGASPARAAKTCKPPKYPGSGYFTSLEVTRVSCTTGRKLALAYYRCRTESGPAGKCHRRVLRYQCKERRVTIPTEIDARVTCRRGARKVVHTYQQNT